MKTDRLLFVKKLWRNQNHFCTIILSIILITISACKPGDDSYASNLANEKIALAAAEMILAQHLQVWEIETISTDIMNQHKRKYWLDITIRLRNRNIAEYWVALEVDPSDPAGFTYVPGKAVLQFDTASAGDMQRWKRDNDWLVLID